MYDPPAKKLEKLKAALSLHLACYNFCQIHSMLRRFANGVQQ